MSCLFRRGISKVDSRSPYVFILEPPLVKASAILAERKKQPEALALDFLLLPQLIRSSPESHLFIVSFVDKPASCPQMKSMPFVLICSITSSIFSSWFRPPLKFCVAATIPLLLFFVTGGVVLLCECRLRSLCGSPLPSLSLSLLSSVLSHLVVCWSLVSLRGAVIAGGLLRLVGSSMFTMGPHVTMLLSASFDTKFALLRCDVFVGLPLCW
jgi:hypothetical protein